MSSTHAPTASRNRSKVAFSHDSGLSCRSLPSAFANPTKSSRERLEFMCSASVRVYCPLTRIEAPPFGVVNFQASAAASCGVAMRYGTGTLACWILHKRRLSNVNIVLSLSTSRIGGILVGLTLPVRSPEARSSIVPPALKLRLILL